MTKHFYAIAHADHDLPHAEMMAFTSKTARDEYVDGGNRRFAKTRVEANEFCRKNFECDAGDAVMRGFI
jgi:hypothetical protein